MPRKTTQGQVSLKSALSLYPLFTLPAQATLAKGAGSYRIPAR